jgi:hypothetical protein
MTLYETGIYRGLHSQTDQKQNIIYHTFPALSNTILQLTNYAVIKIGSPLLQALSVRPLSDVHIALPFTSV